MSTLHGSWILQPANSYLFIWGETWRTLVSEESSPASESVSFHPFNMDRKELLSFLQSHNLSLKKFLNGGIPASQSSRTPKIFKERWQTEVITLPSKTTAKGEPLFPVLSGMLHETIDITSLSLHSWQVEGFRLNPLEAVKFLQALPLGSLQTRDAYVGEDLRFWSQIYRWSLDLLARQKFLPGIDQQPDGKVRSCWQPLLDSSVDQGRFAKLTQLMPSVCRAYQHMENENSQFAEPQELLLGFLSSILDAQLRTWIDISATPPKASTVQPWLQALSQESAYFQAEPKEVNRLETALQNWTLPVQDYLVTSPDNKLGQNQFRTCFSLQPPTSGEINWGYFNWKLQYYLQALDESEFLLDAETIWQHPVERLVVKGRTIEKPQETLLKGLGLAARLYPPIEASLQQSKPLKCELTPIEVYEFIKARAWQLQDSGLGVILPPGLASGAGEKRLGIKIHAEVTRKKGKRLGLQSLLSFDLKLAIGEKTISKKEFESMLAQKSPLVEVNGEWIALQPADVRAAQAVLTQSNDQMTLSVEEALRLSTGETKKIAKLPVVNFEASGILQELINNLMDNRSIEPIEKPEGFRGELRPYQARGVGWLAFLERWNLGACLADDMGLGKTIELIAFMLNLKAQDALSNPTLLVCPTSVLNNWEREVKKFSPTLSTLIHHGDKRSKGKAFAKAVKNKALVITSYPLVYRDEKTLEGVQWQGVVLDEAQNIKNPQAKQSQAVRKLKAGFRIVLTGTPVENRLSELWSILDFLNPGFLGTRQFFQKRFAIPIEKYGDRDSLQTLRSLVRPFILRRLKTDKEIIQDLPDKQEMNVFCGLSAEQAELYQKLVDESLSEIEEATGIQRRGKILTLLLRLKQLCNHPAQFLKEKSLGSGDRSGKLLRLEEMLEELVAEGDRALVFTQFSEWGKLLKPYLEEKLGGEILFLYGATRRQQRQEMIDCFQNDPDGPRIFILSLKAGGTGLNLTRANHVFHVDRWWNPAVENQATDRAFRIGQKRNVQVHKFVCTGTLEERINDMIESKKQLAEQTVDAGEQWLTELDTDQLRNLLLLDRNAVIDEEGS
ncbi:MAG: DEAD/DEAH box helicase [Xenococcaceae cyanobacterium]